MENLDTQTREFVELFVSESTDLIDDAEIRLHKLPKGYDREVIDTIFRMFHSIKGSAGFFNFENIQAVTHQAETLLDMFRKDILHADEDTMDILYQACDILRKMVLNVHQKYSDKGHEEEANELIDKISECIKRFNIKKDNSRIKKSIEDIEKAEKPQEAALIGKFLSESDYLLSKIENNILKYEREPDNPGLIPDSLKNIQIIKKNSAFLKIQHIEERAEDIEVFFETLKLGKTAVNRNIVAFLLKQLEDLKTSILIESSGNKPPDLMQDYQPLGKILVDMGETTEKNIETALDKQQRPLGEILVDEGMISEKVVQKALDIQSKTKNEENVLLNRKDIRVATYKLDKLFELMGELVTAEVMVTRNPELEELNLPNFTKSCNYLSKISRELQEITMSIRMIPLEGLFNKMIRLVRDLSKKSKKQVKLQLKGQETEMDRNVIETISDPLIHILRNAIDHGIEKPSIRKNTGKNEIAEIRLSAKYEGSEIWINITDDGAGLDRKKIIKNAITKGLIEGSGDDLKDPEVWDLIFQPGFSTAEKVTDISGRGVGMDVVKRNIEKLRGNIEVNSSKGDGTEIILKIPLTMAIMDCITVRIGDGLFSIPTTDILEFFKAQEDQISITNKGSEVIKLRDEIMPLIKLYDVFNIHTTNQKASDGILVSVHCNDKKACLLIDEIIGSQQVVIKSFCEYMGRQLGISGCSISGNGEVVLIVDTNSIINNSLN